MKRYDLSKIMKEAHKLYRALRRCGMSFGEVLRMVWRTAKKNVAMREAEARKREEWAKQECFTSDSIYNRMDIPASAFYNANSTGLYGAHYVGD